MLLRWFAGSASLMRVQIGMLSGIVDIHTLFGVFMLTATTMLFGWQMETLNGDRLAVHNIGDSKRIVRTHCCPLALASAMSRQSNRTGLQRAECQSLCFDGQ